MTRNIINNLASSSLNNNAKKGFCNNHITEFVKKVPITTKSGKIKQIKEDILFKKELIKEEEKSIKTQEKLLERIKYDEEKAINTSHYDKLTNVTSQAKERVLNGIKINKANIVALNDEISELKKRLKAIENDGKSNFSILTERK